MHANSANPQGNIGVIIAVTSLRNLAITLLCQHGGNGGVLGVEVREILGTWPGVAVHKILETVNLVLTLVFSETGGTTGIIMVASWSLGTYANCNSHCEATVNH